MTRNRCLWLFVCATALACVAGCSRGTLRTAEADRVGQTATPVVASSTQVTCPSTLPAGSSCVNFVDRRGANGTAVNPSNWNGTLVLFNHAVRVTPVAA